MRQPPENSESGRCCASCVEAEAVQDRGGARRRGMRVDIGEAGLDLGDVMGVVRGLGALEQVGALDVGGEHEVDEPGRAARRLLLDAAEPRARRQGDSPQLGARSRRR